MDLEKHILTLKIIALVFCGIFLLHVSGDTSAYDDEISTLVHHEVNSISHPVLIQIANVAAFSDYTTVANVNVPTSRGEQKDKTASFIKLPEVAEYIDFYAHLRGERLIALTFDDGPSLKITPIILDVLYEEDAVATFFVIGNRVSTHQQVVNRAAAEGHQIANHNYTHRALTRMSQDEANISITLASDVIEYVIGERPTVLRPPYGLHNETVRQAADLPIVLWSIDPRDWEYRDPEIVYRNVMLNPQDGDIILLHDIHLSTARAVGNIVRGLRQQGFVLVTVDELIAVRGEALAGNVYRYFRP